MHQVGPLTVWVVHGGYFAAEKVLDQAFMKEMHERVGAEILLAAMPEKGRLMIANGLASPETTTGALMAVALGAFERNEGGRQISPTVFLISEGKVCGIAQVSTEPEPPKKKGFFSRLFN